MSCTYWFIFIVNKPSKQYNCFATFQFVILLLATNIEDRKDALNFEVISLCINLTVNLISKADNLLMTTNCNKAIELGQLQI